MPVENNIKTILYHTSIVGAVAERVKGSVHYVFYKDGFGWIDYTTEANEATPDDVPLSIAGAFSTDVYIGQDRQFDRMEINITTGSTGPGQLQWQYWNGSAWTILEQARDFLQHGFITGDGPTGLEYYVLSPPTDWAVTSVNGTTAFWIRAHHTTPPDFTIAPLAGQIWVSEMPTRGQIMRVQIM